MPLRKPHPNAKALRKDMPPAERRLWAKLRNRQLGGFRFRRQHTVGPYIADFACVEARLIVELDGDQHGRDDAPARDARRDAFLEEQGWRVLRFWNHEAFENLDGVLETILYEARMRVAELKSRGEADSQ
ncbi:MAG: endonuclease domain-containing protein [Pseudomonadota bacterium]